MPHRIRALVVGVADPDGSDPVLGHAVALAERLGATLHVVHAYALPTATGLAPTSTLVEVGGLMPAWTGPEILQFENGIRAQLRAGLPAGTGSIAVQVHPHPGSAAAAISYVSHAVGADLVLAGGTRHGGLARAILGTTAAQVLREAHIPTLVLRGGLPAAGARVLLTTDLSTSSAASCARGLEIARALSDPGAIRLLHVAGLAGGDLPPRDETDLTAEPGAELRRMSSRLPAAPDEVELVVRMGVPADEIASEASEWRADLVVLGTHSRTGVSRLLRGSVAESVARDLECSALVIPSPASSAPA